jgi:hypothetical protein
MARYAESQSDFGATSAEPSRQNIQAADSKLLNGELGLCEFFSGLLRFRECPARDLRYTRAAKATDDFRDHTNPSRRSNGFSARPATIGRVTNARPAAIKLRIGFLCLQ